MTSDEFPSNKDCSDDWNSTEHDTEEMDLEHFGELYKGDANSSRKQAFALSD